MVRSLRREVKKLNLTCSREIFLISLVLFVFWTAQEIFASDKNQCTASLLRTSAPATRAFQEDVDKAIRDLAGLRLRLDLAKVSGSRALELTALEADFEKKEQELFEYLEANQIMIRDGLREGMKREIARLQNEQQAEQRSDRTREEKKRRRREQEEQIKNSVIDGTRAIFHRIEPGSFKMGEVGKQVDVTLTQPFEMMATPATQIIWKTVAELANSRFGDKYAIDVDPSEFKGDTRPVENVSHDDVQIWLSALNELSQVGEPLLVDLISGHKQGDVYRLPTEAEWEFVVSGRGQYNRKYHFGDEESQLGGYAWFLKNSDGQTQPVAQKKPLMIGVKEFYDMHGNVGEWVSDWYQDQLPGGTDPQGRILGSHRVCRGSHWSSTALVVCSRYRSAWEPENRGGFVGFRPVRTVK